MQIAVIGLGGIGSTFAFQLARAGHEVTVVARGARLEQLRRDGAIITTDDERAPVRVSGELDADTDWDLVLVTVLVSEVDVLLAPLGRCAGKTVMFMFNTFDSLDRLRDAVGPQRFAFGFPALMASVEDGKLSATIPRRGITTTVNEPLWAKVFADAGIPATVHDDMESWLRSHAALIVPLMVNPFLFIVMRTFFKTAIPMSLIEAASIDGSGEFNTLFKIVVPIAKPGIATVGLLFALAYWNEWFLALIYIKNRNLYPLQFLLMQMQMSIETFRRNFHMMGTSTVGGISFMDLPSEGLRMALCAFIVVPIAFAYPFFQRYIIAGLTVGAVKE